MARTQDDLREEAQTGREFRLSLPVSLILAAMMIISGLAVGIILPEDSQEKEPEPDIPDDILNIILSSTLDRIKLGPDTYVDIPVYRALTLISSSDANTTAVEAMVKERFHSGLGFILEGYTGFSLTMEPDARAGEMLRELSFMKGDMNGTHISNTLETYIEVDMEGMEDLFLLTRLTTHREVISSE